MSAPCSNCGHVEPPKPRGRERLYDVSDLEIGWSRAFRFRDDRQRRSIAGSLRYAAQRDGTRYRTRTSAPGVLEVTRIA